MNVYYAQNREDLIIKGFFPDIKTGFYIDVGSNDPVIDSVTKLFYDEGWRGINIDPIKKYIDAFEKSRPEDVNLNIGVANKTGELSFREYPKGDGLSTVDESMKTYYTKAKHSFPTDRYRDYKIKVKTLDSIIRENNVRHIHFIKIDVEGFEYEVVSSYKWDKPRPELICIEASHIHKDWKPLLKQSDYQLVFFDGVNNYYLAKESLFRNDYFNYADATLSGSPIYYSSYLALKDKPEKQEWESAAQKILTLATKITDQENEISSLHSQQRDLRFLVKRLNQEIIIRLNRRAKLNISKVPMLKYDKDESITNLVKDNQNVSGKDLITTLHKRDQHNIKLEAAHLLPYLKGVIWKIVAKIYSLNTKLVRRIVNI